MTTERTHYYHPGGEWRAAVSPGYPWRSHEISRTDTGATVAYIVKSGWGQLDDNYARLVAGAPAVRAVLIEVEQVLADVPGASQLYDRVRAVLAAVEPILGEVQS